MKNVIARPDPFFVLKNDDFQGEVAKPAPKNYTSNLE